MRKLSKTLVMHAGAMGDVICSLSAVRRFAGGAETVDFAVQGLLGPLLLRIGAAGRCLPLDAPLFSSLYGSNPSRRLLEMLAGYGRIVLFSFSDLLEAELRGRLGCPVLRVPPRPEPSERIHVSDFIEGRLAAALELEAPSAPRAPDADAAVRPGRDEKRILLHPGSGSPRKCWPLQRFVASAYRLRQMGYRPAFVLGPAEVERFHDAGERIPTDLPSVFPDDPVQLLHRLLEAGALVGNDSGVSHLAAHCGLPTLALFGPSDPRRWHPRGRTVRVLRGAPDCAPCFEREPANCPDPRCMANTSVDVVCSAARGLMRTPGVHAGSLDKASQMR